MQLDMEPSKSLNGPCARDLVQGWAAASLELRVCSGSSFSLVWGLGGHRGRVPNPRPAAGPWLARGPGGEALSIIRTVSLPLVRGKGPVAEGFGRVRNVSAPGQPVALDFLLYKEV